MQYVKLFTLISFFVYAGCNNEWKSSDNIKSFILGTYAKEVKNEFLIASDTLVIQCMSGNNYLIVNRTAYQRFRNSKLLPQQYAEEIWKAVYDEQSRNLYEQRLGKTFSFDPAHGRLFDGGSEYKKVIP